MTHRCNYWVPLTTPREILLSSVVLFSSKCLAAFLLALLRNHHSWQRCLSQMLRSLKEEGLQGTAFAVRLLPLYGELYPPFPGQHQQRLFTPRREYISVLQSAEMGFWERSWARRVEWVVLCSFKSFIWFKHLKPYKLSVLIEFCKWNKSVFLKNSCQ